MARILLVEDHPAHSTLLAHFIRAVGHEVDIVTNGRQAVIHALAAPPDLLVLDLVLPAMHGVEVVRHLRRFPVLAHTPILALSAYATEAGRIEALAAGCSVYESKPIGFAPFVAQIALLLNEPPRSRAIGE